VFSDIHPRFRTPWKSNALFAVFVGCLAGFLPITIVGEMTSIGTLFAFILVSLGVLILRYAQPELPRAFRTPWVPFVPVMGILTCGFMMYGLPWDTWLRLVVWMAIGLAIYFGYGARRSLLRKSVVTVQS
jgi:APA family basic amino acid/polyamine antiporter